VRRLLLHELEFHFQEVEVHHLDHTTLHMHFIKFFFNSIEYNIPQLDAVAHTML
jgi:hypothetical protein